MGKRVDFERLKTIDDVHKERLRVRYDIQHCEHLLKNDMERVGEVFTPDYWMAIISRKAAEVVQEVSEKVASKIRGFASGWGIVDSLLSRFGIFGGSSCNRRNPEYYAEEEDYYYIPDDDEEEYFNGNRTC